MVYGFAAKTSQKPTWCQLKHSIMRNFGGLEEVKSVEIFHKHLIKTTVVIEEKVDQLIISYIYIYIY